MRCFGTGAGPPPPPPAPPPPPDPPELRARERLEAEAARKAQEAADASRKRMAFIVAYVKDHASNPIFADKALMYKVLTEERTHQQGLLGAAGEELGRLPPPPEALGMAEAEWRADARLVAQEARRAELEKKVKQAKAVQTQIFNLLKSITGVRHAEGGVDFVAEPEIAQTTEETSTEDAFGAAGAVLARLKKKP